MENKHIRFLRNLLYVVLGLAAAWLFLPWLLPFLVAFGLASLLERPVSLLIDRGHLPRPAAAGLCIALLAALLAALAGLIIWRGCYELGILFEALPTLLSKLPDWQTALDHFVYRLVVAAPLSVQDFLRSTAEAVIHQGIALPSGLYTWLLDWVSAATAAIPRTILFTFTTILATYFSSAHRPALLSFLRRQIPRGWLPKLRETKRRLSSALGNWLKAQGMLLFVTFLILTGGLLLLGTDLALLIAAATALLDALPIFGTGVVLIPWAIISLLSSNFFQAIGLAALYALLSLVRTFLEPKLVGDRVGLPPLSTLFAMYGGFHFFGVLGMILSPLVAILIKQLHDCGLLRLWRE